MKISMIPMPPARATRRGRGAPGAARCRGYSFLEITGVLVVIAILSAALVPSLMKQLDELTRRQEADALSTLAGGLREYILNERQIPAPAAAFSNVAQQLGWSLYNVSTNSRHQARLLLVDPNFRVGNITVTNLPYVQGLYGASNVSNARMMWVSSLAGPLPGILSNPGTNAATVFNLIWDTPEGTQPPGWLWDGDWNNILVQRVNLEALFTQVILNNNWYQTGRFSIDNTNLHVALPANPYSGRYLLRTVLGLHGDSATQNGQLQVKQVLQDLATVTNPSPYQLCPSFVYERGVWRGRLFMTPPPPRRSGRDLQAAYEIFMSGPPNVYKVGNVNQSSVTLKMWTFMSNYVRWAELGFSSSFKSKVTSAQSTMASQVKTYCNKKAKAP